MDNINKQEFKIRILNYYQDDVYTKDLHKDLTSICNNILYHFDFNDPAFLKEDCVSEMMMHFHYKKNKLKTYENRNAYNLIFTVMKRRFLDLLHKYTKRKGRSIDELNLANIYMDSMELESCREILDSFDTEEEIEYESYHDISEALDCGEVSYDEALKAFEVLNKSERNQKIKKMSMDEVFGRLRR